MNIVYSSDEKFAMILGVSLQSLYEAHPQTDDLAVYIINNGLAKESQASLRQIAASFHRTLTITDEISADAMCSVFLNCQNTWSSAAYSRLFVGTIFPSLQKIIYLDCDVMVRHSIDALWQFDLRGNSCAAVYEPFGKWHKKSIGLTADDRYINTGVMIIDLDAWRQQRREEDFIRYIQSQNGKIPFVDQGVLNHVLLNRISQLPFGYNVSTIYYDFGYQGTQIARGAKHDYPQADIQTALQDPCIVHFTNSYVSNRPWIIGSEHPCAQEWLSRKAGTPWADAPLWEDTRGKDRTISRKIYEHLPGTWGYRFSYFANGVVRPLLRK